MTGWPLRIDGLRKAREPLASLGDDVVLSALDAVLGEGLAEGGWLESVVGELAGTRFEHPDLLRLGLRRMLAAHRRPGLDRWLAAAREEARERPACLPAPGFVVQVLAGNVAGLGVPAACELLLARCAGVLKTPREDPVTPRRFLAEVAARLPVAGRAIVAEDWRGGDRAVEDALFGNADWLVASGDDDTVAALAGRSPGETLRGPRFSVGVVGEEAASGWETAVCRETVLHEQRGCLSPRRLFLAGDVDDTAGRLADALGDLEARWPSRKTPAEASSVLAARAAAELSGHRVIASSGAEWTVMVDPGASLAPGPGGRTLVLSGLPSRRAFAALVAPARHRLQAVGVLGLGDETPVWREALSAAGAPWVPELDRIQDPPAGWRADGRSPLAELLGARPVHSSHGD